MNARTPLLAALALALASTACQPPAQEAGPLSDEDVAAIRGLADIHSQTLLAGDWAGFVATCTDDIVLMPPDQPIVQGRDAALSWFESFPTLTEISIAVEQVDGRGDLAVDRGTYAMSFEVDGGTQSVTGKYLAVWRKQPDGSWLMATDAWNLDHPLPEEGSGT